MSIIGYISTDGGQTFDALPDSGTLLDADYEVGECARDRFKCWDGTVTMYVRKIHIGSLRPFLGEHYREFRRRYLSARKHRSGRFRK